MKIFLTGSTSYLGTKFVDLFGDKFDIFGVARHDPDHQLDLMDAASIRELYDQFRPDVIVHLAADVGRDTTTGDAIKKTNPAIVQNLIGLALPRNTPVVFTSTEAVYGGKERAGDYSETDPYKPRSPYGESKVLSEKLLKASGLPYLITRGHRHVGISRRFHNKKWFPDTLNDLVSGQQVHLDSKKIFNPVLINHACQILAHYIEHDLNKQIILNMGVEKKLTYFDFVTDAAAALNLNSGLIHDDGSEAGWPQNSSVSVKKLAEMGYPTIVYEDLLLEIAQDFGNT